MLMKIPFYTISLVNYRKLLNNRVAHLPEGIFRGLVVLRSL